MLGGIGAAIGVGGDRISDTNGTQNAHIIPGIFRENTVNMFY